MIAAAQSGKHSEKRASYGHAMIISPWGEILAQINDSESTGIGFAEINLDKLT
jgi:predicted amidohydrolase